MILGVWDGHDSGAAIVEDGKILVAVNEERFTKRKLEVLFPHNSIRYCLAYLDIKPSDIKDIAYSTSDFSLTLTRKFPKIKDDYYYIRRRMKKTPFPGANRRIINFTGTLKSNSLFRHISNHSFKSELKKQGFEKYRLHLVEHHNAHVASAYLCSGFKKSLTLTLDGLGDGLSGSVSVCNGSEIEKVKEIKTIDSLGLFYQEITSILNMRILEDEGKVMCLADYSEKIKKENNPMMKFFKVEDGNIKSRNTLEKRYAILKRLKESMNRTRFCRMAQDVLEHYSLEFFKQNIGEYGIKELSMSGGVFSNIKNNMNIVNNLNIKKWFIFPHMGDGGLAAGAALFVENKTKGTSPKRLSSLSLGPEYKDKEILDSLKLFKKKITWRKEKDTEGFAAEKIAKSDVIYWVKGKMEYGPRALGNRSILTRPDKKEMIAILNKLIKRRDWFQPFCPSILEKDARQFLHKYDISDPFMTMGYKIKENKRSQLVAAQSVDGTCRPQIIKEGEYASLIKKIKKKTGFGGVLNTSFNIHGEPLVNDPKDAIKTLLKAKRGTLIINDYIVNIR